MSTLNDLTLIQRFVQGKAFLESNRNLRVESALGTTRLFTKRGVFLAKFKLILSIRYALVRQESQYCEVISQMLVEHNFMPTGVTEQGLMRYEHQSIPHGYEMQYTEARLLWKAWRTQLRQKPSQPMQPKILLHTLKGWQCVQNINNSQQLLFVETLDDELMIHSGDRTIWLSPIEEQPKTQIFAYRLLAETQPSEASSESLQILNSVMQMKEGKLHVQASQA